MVHTIFILTVKWIILFSIVQCSVFACPCMYDMMEPCSAEMTRGCYCWSQHEFFRPLQWCRKCLLFCGMWGCITRWLVKCLWTFWPLKMRPLCCCENNGHKSPSCTVPHPRMKETSNNDCVAVEMVGVVFCVELGLWYASKEWVK